MLQLLHGYIRGEKHTQEAIQARIDPTKITIYSENSYLFCANIKNLAFNFTTRKLCCFGNVDNIKSFQKISVICKVHMDTMPQNIKFLLLVALKFD